MFITLHGKKQLMLAGLAIVPSDLWKGYLTNPSQKCIYYQYSMWTRWFDRRHAWCEWTLPYGYICFLNICIKLFNLLLSEKKRILMYLSEYRYICFLICLQSLHAMSVHILFYKTKNKNKNESVYTMSYKYITYYIYKRVIS